jgi:phenylpyruvate tautomerase PptA (4-oxalocrotonate tautomerase family)
LECDTHKNARANRIKLCKRTTRKLRATKMCSKSSIVVAICLLPTENWIWRKLLISKRNRKQKNAVKVVANAVLRQNLEQKNHLRRLERESD